MKKVSAQRLKGGTLRLLRCIRRLTNRRYVQEQHDGGKDGQYE
jgi:hypothetical protein